jgi:hypothetical protein
MTKEEIFELRDKAQAALNNLTNACINVKFDIQPTIDFRQITHEDGKDIRKFTIIMIEKS